MTKTVDELMRLADEYANAIVVQVNEATFWESDASAEPACAALRSALEEVVANDRRYRWLRAQPNDTSTPRIDVVLWEPEDESESCNSGTGLRRDALDAAIDAMQQAPEQDG